MKKTLMRILVLMLACVMLLGTMSGCGVEEAGPTDPVNVRDPYKEPITTEPVTITILTQRHSGTTNNAEDLWFFKYMEYYLAQYGYNVTINVEQTGDAGTKTLTLLGADALPDIMWSMEISETNQLKYGVDDNLILNLKPYLNETVMPNVYKQFQENPEMLTASTTPADTVLTLPYILPPMWSSTRQNNSAASAMYVRQSWLTACGLEMPDTEEEFFDMLRAFKNYSSAGIAVADLSNQLEYYLWTCLGYYGGLQKNGFAPSIKDGEVVLPVMTEDYRTFIGYMKTIYSEGLVDSRYYSTYSKSIANTQAAQGKVGVFGASTLGAVGEDYMDYVSLGPIAMGGNDDVYMTRLNTYNTGKLWASSKTQYPEIVCMIMDYIYSEEGSMMYRYGPKQGEDPLGLLDGWYYNASGDITCADVENGTFATMEEWGRQVVYPADGVGLRPAVVTNGTGEILTFKDAVTGKELYGIDNVDVDSDPKSYWWRKTSCDTWEPYCTDVSLGGVWLSEAENIEITDLKTVLNSYINTESAKFITGIRPMSEIDQFWEELKAMDIERYLEIYKEAYAPYMESVFGK